jgi:hypothetical protein
MDRSTIPYGKLVFKQNGICCRHSVASSDVVAYCENAIERHQMEEVEQYEPIDRSKAKLN